MKGACSLLDAKTNDRIKDGEFAKEWGKEQKENHLGTLEKLEEDSFSCELTKAEDRLKAKLK